MLNTINEAMFTYSIWSLKFMQCSVLSLIFLDSAFMLMQEEKIKILITETKCQRSSSGSGSTD